MRELHKKMVHLGVNILNIKKAWERGFFDRPIYKGEKNKYMLIFFSRTVPCLKDQYTV
jgi:hypothetical protein